MDFVQIECGGDDAGRRADRVLRKCLPALPLGEIYKHLRKGTIKVNGKKIAQDYRIAAGDVIYLARFLVDEPPADNAQTTAPSNTATTSNAPAIADLPKLGEIFRNEHLLVVNKPCGLAVQAARKGETCVASIVAAAYAQSAAQSLSFRPAPLHRLDRNTSGLLVCSQSLQGAQWFSKALQDNVLSKEYLGIVCGEVQNEEYWIDFIDDANEGEAFGTSGTTKATGANGAKSGFATVKVDSAKGKEARTRCTPLLHGSYNNQRISLCRFCIETGRKHQIRAQSAFHGFVLFGDTAYDSPVRTNMKSGERIFYLHAHKLNVQAPNPVDLPPALTAPLPKDFADFLQKHFAPSSDFINSICAALL